MWEVVGFSERAGKNDVYVNLYVQRECKAPGQGIQCFAGSYGKAKVAYSPRIGDKLWIEMGNYQGRDYIRDITLVS